jgi:valyl-tRNA synthetase
MIALRTVLTSNRPFLTEELWQRLPRRPGQSAASIVLADYPTYNAAFQDPHAAFEYQLVLGCITGIRSLCERKCRS